MHKFGRRRIGRRRKAQLRRLSRELHDLREQMARAEAAGDDQKTWELLYRIANTTRQLGPLLDE
jgi:hypothetical protein